MFNQTNTPATQASAARPSFLAGFLALALLLALLSGLSVPSAAATLQITSAAPQYIYAGQAVGIVQSSAGPLVQLGFNGILVTPQALAVTASTPTGPVERVQAALAAAMLGMFPPSTLTYAVAATYQTAIWNANANVYPTYGASGVILAGAQTAEALFPGVADLSFITIYTVTGMGLPVRLAGFTAYCSAACVGNTQGGGDGGNGNGSPVPEPRTWLMLTSAVLLAPVRWLCRASRKVFMHYDGYAE